MHVGGQGNPLFTGHRPKGPSRYFCKATGFESDELTHDEIKSLRDQFIHSAIMAEQAGFHAVELHLAHGYLLHQFLSSYTNKRKDAYGGSVINRFRLVKEIISGIKEKAPGLIIGTRISGEDYVPDGINQEENKMFIPKLEESGVAYFSVTAGIYDTSARKHESMNRGEFFGYARGIKQITHLPVIGAGKILEMESAERQLIEENCDIVAIGRGLIADPSMPDKATNGVAYQRCTECGRCQFLKHGEKELACPLRG
jgi:2,4-dienoyl-CoA reductase-like NADH-dependent reductase (Old Yellow Enzyme family)